MCAGLLASAPASSAGTEAVQGSSALASCGFRADVSAFYYDHCGAGNVLIQIDYPINNTAKCVGQGTTFLQWRSDNYFTNPTNAFYIGSC